MKLRRSRKAPSPAAGPAGFDWRVIPCADREAAAAEAARQQSADTEDVEWIYLQLDDKWIAKRTPRDILGAPNPTSTKGSIVDGLVDGLFY